MSNAELEEVLREVAMCARDVAAGFGTGEGRAALTEFAHRLDKRADAVMSMDMIRTGAWKPRR